MKKFLANIYLDYIKFFAKLRLSVVSPTIIGIGGSSGKSSLANLVTLVLSQKYNVHSSSGKNSETGIPLDILGIKISDYSYLFWIKSVILAPFKVFINKNNMDFYVVEMGIDSPKPPKNMKSLLEIVKPSIGVLTNINIEHSVYFDELVDVDSEKNRKEEILEYIAKEEGLILTSLDEKSKSVVNLDDNYIKKLLPLKSNVLKVSKSSNDTDFKIKKVTVDKTSFEITFGFLKEEYSIKINQPLPKYFAKTIMLTVAVCFSSGISIKDIIAIIESNFALPSGRFSVFKGVKKTTIIDSSYNSSLEATVGAIEVLRDIEKENRRVAILGDMRELGSLSKIQHVELAEKIIKEIDFAILIGPDMDEFVVPVLDKAKFGYLSFITFTDAKSSLLKSIKEQDLILVKGSQNSLFLERVVELLLGNKDDIKKLPRRGDFWDKERLSTK